MMHVTKTGKGINLGPAGPIRRFAPAAPGRCSGPAPTAAHPSSLRRTAGRSSALWRSNCSLCFRSGCISCGPWRDLLARRTPRRTVVYQHSTPERLSGVQAAPGKGRQGKETPGVEPCASTPAAGSWNRSQRRRRRRHAVVRLASIILILILCVSLGGPILAAQPMEYRLGDRTLSYGAWGADVFELQLRLRELGYSLAADGHFGSETRRVVTAFQLAYGLRPDGIAGPATLAALQSLRSTFTYVVQPGDSLWAIARRFGVSMEEIVRLNNLPDRPLWVGDRLILPARPVYRVQPGDTLWEIARRFGTTVEELAELNGIADPSRIRAGSELRLPAGALPAGGF
ncbi:MAG: hypothetical protein CW345_03785 [Firmicutes bacterium]|nr:hypothetical protein [Bacillota bacterium]MBO2520914.1 hypothetical protein [Bacillota bacterium]